MKAKVIALVFSIVLLLAGCTGLTGPSVSAHISGGQIGYEVDDEGKIIIFQSQVTFFNQAGAPPARVVGYSVRFSNMSGNSIPGLEPLTGEDNIVALVPAGIFCSEEVVGNCSRQNGGIDREMSSEPYNLATLPGYVPLYMEVVGQDYIRADITFDVRQAGRADYQIVSRVDVVNPFTGEE